jgi:hypothetical protein
MSHDGDSGRHKPEHELRSLLSDTDWRARAVAVSSDIFLDDAVAVAVREAAAEPARQTERSESHHGQPDQRGRHVLSVLPQRRKNDTAKAAATARSRPMCTRPVPWAGVRPGSRSRSMTPNTAGVAGWRWCTDAVPMVTSAAGLRCWRRARRAQARTARRRRPAAQRGSPRRSGAHPRSRPRVPGQTDLRRMERTRSRCAGSVPGDHQRDRRARAGPRPGPQTGLRASGSARTRRGLDLSLRRTSGVAHGCRGRPHRRRLGPSPPRSVERLPIELPRDVGDIGRELLQEEPDRSDVPCDPDEPGIEPAGEIGNCVRHLTCVGLPSVLGSLLEPALRPAPRMSPVQRATLTWRVVLTILGKSWYP